MKPKIFIEVLFSLCEPDMFNVAPTEEEEDNIFEKTMLLSKTEKIIPTNFLEWRDLVYDAMESLGFQLAN